jgi:hypothetical protein
MSGSGSRGYFREMFSREKIAKAAQELADHLQIIENVESL